ncbi:hypothetical protein FS749_005238 [Ceratobasidium sp. UAMH 11750]|nr:hypothetical protein FS749_005238 [Ceratobasidium sp. UAMH 11750]
MTTPLSPCKALHDSSQRLDEAIQSYLEHAQALETAVGNNASGRHTLDKLFAEVRAEQVSAPSKINMLKTAVAVLNRVHNQSIAFVPIQSLPDDVLIHIFTLACTRCRFFPTTERPISKCRITKTMLAVTHVCADWRRLAINTPILWTHVDIMDNGPRSRPGYEKMWLERVGSAPLSVRVAIQHDTSGDYTEGALNQLVPHFGAIRSLGLHADSRHALQAALMYWMSNGTPGSVQELLLTGRAKLPGQRTANSATFADHFPLRLAVLNSFLAPIQILHLQYVSVSLVDTICRGLIHIEPSDLTPKAPSPTFRLSSLPTISPKLRILKLEKLRMDSTQYFRLFGAIELNALERLELVDLSPDPCLTLLSVLHPGPGELTLRLSAPTNPSDEEAVRSFLSRSNVTKLFIKVHSDYPPVAADCFGAITDLGMLAIHFDGHHPQCDPLLQALLPLPEFSLTCRWPRLHGLWLIEGGCECDMFKGIIEAYRIQTLMLSLVYSPGPCFIQEQIQPLVGELIVEDDEDSVWYSDFAEWYTKC